MSLSAQSGAVQGYRYLPVSQEMRSWECFVTTAGSAVYAPGESYPHRTHPNIYDFDWRCGRTLPEYQIVLITDGAGEYEHRQGEVVRCTQGDVIQIVPGQWHRYRPAARTGWAECCIGLGGAYLHRLRGKSLAFTHPRLATGESYKAIHDAMHDVVQTVLHRGCPNSPLLASEVFKIVALIAQVDTASGKEKSLVPNRNENLGRALEFIWGGSHRAIQVADVAEAVRLNPRSLERLFAANHSSSVRQEIEWSRFFRAQRLITQTNLPMKEIAYACGFSDPRRMIEVFRRRGGIAPSQLRMGEPLGPDKARGAGGYATAGIRDARAAVSSPLPSAR